MEQSSKVSSWCSAKRQVHGTSSTVPRAITYWLYSNSLQYSSKLDHPQPTHTATLSKDFSLHVIFATRQAVGMQSNQHPATPLPMSPSQPLANQANSYSQPNTTNNVVCTLYLVCCLFAVVVVCSLNHIYNIYYLRYNVQFNKAYIISKLAQISDGSYQIQLTIYETDNSNIKQFYPA